MDNQAFNREIRRKAGRVPEEEKPQDVKPRESINPQAVPSPPSPPDVSGAMNEAIREAFYRKER